MSCGSVEFSVYGLPAPKGSHKAFVNRKTGRVIVAPDSARQRGWEKDVAYAARNAMGVRPPFTTPVVVRFEFMLPRPKRHYGKGDVLRADAPSRPGIRPDWDKLARAVGDALSGIVYADDALVVEALVTKHYSELSLFTCVFPGGVRVRVNEVQ